MVIPGAYTVFAPGVDHGMSVFSPPMNPGPYYPLDIFLSLLHALPDAVWAEESIVEKGQNIQKDKKKKISKLAKKDNHEELLALKKHAKKMEKEVKGDGSGGKEKGAGKEERKKEGG